MTFDMVVDGLAVIGAGTCLWWAVVGLGRLLGWIERSEIARQEAEAASQPAKAAPTFAPVPAAASAPDELTPDLLVVISAAVAAFGDGLRVVQIAEPATGQAWAAEGRWMHQTSHRTH